MIKNKDNFYEKSIVSDREKMLEDIFIKTDDLNMDNADELLGIPVLTIDLEEVNNSALSRSTDIIEHLSGYYINKKYIAEHPYIKNKIIQEIDNIRRLLKMLTINEKAQDSLIQSITCNFGKSALYTALTSLQSSTLSIQKQLNESVDTIETIFRKMQDECQESFESKDKEELSDGSIVTRGTRDFLKDLMNKLNGEQKQEETEEEEENVINAENLF
jgi:translation elongation factor EF-G